MHVPPPRLVYPLSPDMRPRAATNRLSLPLPVTLCFWVTSGQMHAAAGERSAEGSAVALQVWAFAAERTAAPHACEDRAPTAERTDCPTQSALRVARAPWFLPPIRAPGC